MELYQLRTFVTVAEMGNLTHAAERLFTSQPAISAHVKALEQELNVILFHRTSKGMRLTEHGENLRKKAHQVLTAANELQLEATSLSGELAGVVKVGLNTDAEFLRISDLHSRIMKKNPQLKIHFMEGISAELLQEIQRGSLDGTFFFGHNRLNKLEAVTLTSTEIVVAGATKWQDVLSQTSVNGLSKVPWINPVSFCPYSGFIKELFGNLPKQPEWVADAASERSMNALLRSGVGLCLIRQDEAQSMVEDGLIKIWKGQTFTLPLRFAYLKKRKKDPLIKALVQCVSASFSEIRAPEPEQETGN